MHRFILVGICSILLILVGTQLGNAHGGGLDSRGCHNDRQNGGYHCHQGPLAGRSFASAADAVRALSETAAPIQPAPTATRQGEVTPPSVAPAQISQQAIAELQAAVAELRAEVARLSELVEKLTQQLAEKE